MEALRAMEAQGILTVYCDFKTKAAVLLHVRQPERFWNECVAHRMLPPPLLPEAVGAVKEGAFLTENTADGWGWAQHIYADEGVEEMPWICRETFPADPVGALGGREFTLVWRFCHSLANKTSWINESEAFMQKPTRPHMSVSGPAAIPMYLYHTLPLGTDVCPYSTLLYYLRLEYLNSVRHIDIQKRSVRGRPIQWAINPTAATTRERLRAAFPPYFYTTTTTTVHRTQVSRTTNWLGLPFLRIDGNDAVCSVYDLLNQGDAFFRGEPHVVEHLPLLSLLDSTTTMVTPTPHLLDTPQMEGLLKEYDLSGNRKQPAIGAGKRPLKGGEPPPAKKRGLPSLAGPPP